MRWLAHERYPAAQYLQAFDGQVLVLRAGRDAIVPARNTDRLLAALGDAEAAIPTLSVPDTLVEQAAHLAGDVVDRSALARIPTVTLAASSASVGATAGGSGNTVLSDNWMPDGASWPASRLTGGSLKARATRIDCGRRNTSAVGPYCNSSPASSTAV